MREFLCSKSFCKCYAVSEAAKRKLCVLLEAFFLDHEANAHLSHNVEELVLNPYFGG